MAQTAIKVNAVVATLVSVTIGVLCSCAFTFLTDQAANDAAVKFLEFCSDGVRSQLELAANNLQLAGAVIGQLPNLSYTFAHDTWREITKDVNAFATGYNPSGITVTPSSSTNHVGFTEESQFTIHFNKLDENSQNRSIQNVFVNDMTITFYDPQPYKTAFSHYPWTSEIDDDFYNSNSSTLLSSYVVSSRYLNMQFFGYKDRPYNSNSDQINRAKFSGDYISKADGTLRFTYNSNKSIFTLLHEGFSSSEKFLNVFTIDSVPCYLMRCKSDSKFRFVTYNSVTKSDSEYEYKYLENTKTKVVYHEFSTLQEFYSVFCEANALDFPAVGGRDSVDDGVYVPGRSDVKVPANVDVYNGANDATLNIPTTQTADGDYVADIEATITANPADVLTYEKTEVKFPDGVPKIDSSGLFDKFPFCIPVDIYHLFVGFSAEAAPPVFKIPFKYFERDGKYLIDEEITIDFSELSEIAYLCRWFISIEFVLGLVLITRKVIGA